LPEWPGQVRGVPWISPALRSLAMLDGYREAELTAARVAAAKMGFYTIGSDEEVPAELEADGALVQEATPGGFELLPKGVDFKNFDPQHPNQAFADFVAAALRPAASAVGLSYNAFANDAQGLNYSALRATELEDRDEFKTLQAWMISSFCVPMFRDWLEAALLNDALGLPASKLWKFNAPEFIGRGWQWVDPRNEVASNAEAVALGIKSRTQIVAEQGGDIADVAADLRREAELLRGLIDPGRMPSAASLANQEDTTQ
jgi:lambda family phage portal protein